MASRTTRSVDLFFDRMFKRDTVASRGQKSSIEKPTKSKSVPRRRTKTTGSTITQACCTGNQRSKSHRRADQPQSEISTGDTRDPTKSTRQIIIGRDQPQSKIIRRDKSGRRRSTGRQPYNGQPSSGTSNRTNSTTKKRHDKRPHEKKIKQKAVDSFYDRLSKENTVASNGLKSKTKTSTKSKLESKRDTKLSRTDPLQLSRRSIFRNSIELSSEKDLFYDRLSKEDTTSSKGLKSKATIRLRPGLEDQSRKTSMSSMSVSVPDECNKSINGTLTTEISSISSRTLRRKGGIDQNIMIAFNASLRPHLQLNTYSHNKKVNFTAFSASLRETTENFISLLKNERTSDWLSSFRRLDPRYQILKFFNDVAREGANRIEEASYTIHEEALTSPILQGFSRAAAFSVWRPTSNAAIRKMMTGEGTGKGLDVKGKSAKKGRLSGFIPFLQIHDETHKSKIRWPPREGNIRIYYKNEAARNKAALELTSVSSEMQATVSKAKIAIANSCSDKGQHQMALENLIFDVADPKVHQIDDYSPSCFGIVVAERTFFKTYISRQDITRSSDYQTGRPSEPAFQDMNFTCTRKYKGSGPRAVVLQLSETVNDALSPESLVVAYEEHGNVTPVASDFDCFLVGTRGVSYESPLSAEQVDLLKWLLTQIVAILDSPRTSKSWTSRWLEVLKESAKKGFYPKTPEFGFGDPKSYAIMEDVVGRLRNNGAVRHGAESFNFHFPQELDDNFMVIGNDLEGNIPWKNVNVQELQGMLCDRIDQGFTFPLNPKWILADRGWKAVYDKMMCSENESVRKSLAVWYPPGSGIRELIEKIYTRFPDGFQRLNIENGNKDEKTEGTEARDLAEQQLKRHLILQRAKFKLRCVICFMKMRK